MSTIDSGVNSNSDHALGNTQGNDEKQPEILQPQDQADAMQQAIPQTQSEIIQALYAIQTFDVQREIELRTSFISRQISRNSIKSLVLGISGGVDSLTAGFLAQAAVLQSNANGNACTLLAVRLPYGLQKDEKDAQQCLDQIKPGRILDVDIKPACDALLASLKAGGITFNTPEQEDFVLGNIKARQRMIVQYAIANANDGLVIGTDQAAEALMGFFTKYGDGGADITPLTGLNKRQVRAIAKTFGAPDHLVSKIPTADLESLSPLKPDEEAFGVTYADIDDFLEGKTIDSAAYNVIVEQYRHTEHKRQLPAHPYVPSSVDQ